MMTQISFLQPIINLSVDESQLVEPDICRNRHGGVETSVLADRRVQKSQDRQLVLGYITAARTFGHTLDEISILIDRPCNCISGRFTELCKANLIIKTATKRKTRTGALAAVYIATSQR
jgi:hypothetical protein